MSNCGVGSLLVLLVLAVLVKGEDSLWSYSGRNGPSKWQGTCKTGLEQSPVNLDNQRMVKKAVESFSFFNYGTNDGNYCLLINNGHTVMLSMKSPIVGGLPEVKGGGLPAKFAFAQLHFHWGSKDEQGSEHSIDGTFSPMEVHLVHFNTEYGMTIADAVANGNDNYDTLAVLSFLFRIDPTDNKNLEPVIEALPMVKLNSAKVPVNCFSMKNFFANDTSHFYRYNGSLTTPPCSENVIWTVFKTPIPISAKQMQFFRGLTTGDVRSPKPLLDNFRPIQILNDREIWDMTASNGLVITINYELMTVPMSLVIAYILN